MFIQLINLTKRSIRISFIDINDGTMKSMGTINDNDNNSTRKGIDYAMLTHNPYQKHIKNPPTVIGKK